MPVPSAPSGLCIISTVNSLCVRASWNPVSGAVSYSLYRSDVLHDDFSLAASGITGLTYFDNPVADRLDLNLRNRRYYRVSTINADGEGARSAPATYDPYGNIIHQNKPIPGLSWSDFLG